MSSTTTHCPTCGVPVAAGTVTCGNCGSSVHPTGSYPVVTAPVAALPPPARRRRGLVLVLALLLAAAAAIGVATRAGAAPLDAPADPMADPLADPAAGAPAD